MAAGRSSQELERARRALESLEPEMVRAEKTLEVLDLVGTAFRSNRGVPQSGGDLKSMISQAVKIIEFLYTGSRAFPRAEPLISVFAAVTNWCDDSKTAQEAERIFKMVFDEKRLYGQLMNGGGPRIAIESLLRNSDEYVLVKWVVDIIKKNNPDISAAAVNDFMEAFRGIDPAAVGSDEQAEKLGAFLFWLLGNARNKMPGVDKLALNKGAFDRFCAIMSRLPKNVRVVYYESIVHWTDSDSGEEPNISFLKALHEARVKDVFDITRGFFTAGGPIAERVDKVFPVDSWFCADFLPLNVAMDFLKDLHVQWFPAVERCLPSFMRECSEKPPETEDVYVACLSVICGEIVRARLTVERLVEFGFVQAFFVSPKPEPFARMWSYNEHIILAIRVYSEYMCERHSEVFSRALQSFPHYVAPSAFLRFAGDLFVCVPSKEKMKILLEWIWKSEAPDGLDLLKNVFLEHSVVAEHFVDCGGLEWCKESYDAGRITAVQYAELISHVVVFRGFSEVDIHIRKMESDHPIFSLDVSILEAMVYGKSAGKYKPIRIPSLFPWIEAPQTIDPYNAWILGRYVVSRYLSRGVAIFDIPLIRQIGNRFLMGKHAKLLAAKPLETPNYCNFDAFDHFPLYQFSQGSGVLNLHRRFSAISFWVKFVDTSDRIPFFYTGLISARLSNLVIQWFVDNNEICSTPIHAKTWNHVVLMRNEGWFSAMASVFVNGVECEKKLKMGSLFENARFEYVATSLMFIGPGIRLVGDKGCDRAFVNAVRENGPGFLGKIGREVVILPYHYSSPFGRGKKRGNDIEQCVIVPYFGFPCQFLSTSNLMDMFDAIRDTKDANDFNRMFMVLVKSTRIIDGTYEHFWTHILDLFYDKQEFVSIDNLVYTLHTIFRTETGVPKVAGLMKQVRLMMTTPIAQVGADRVIDAIIQCVRAYYHGEVAKYFPYDELKDYMLFTGADSALRLLSFILVMRRQLPSYCAIDGELVLIVARLSDRANIWEVVMDSTLDTLPLVLSVVWAVMVVMIQPDPPDATRGIVNSKWWATALRLLSTNISKVMNNRACLKVLYKWFPFGISSPFIADSRLNRKATTFVELFSDWPSTVPVGQVLDIHKVTIPTESQEHVARITRFLRDVNLCRLFEKEVWDVLFKSISSELQAADFMQTIGSPIVAVFLAFCVSGDRHDLLAEFLPRWHRNHGLLVGLRHPLISRGLNIVTTRYPKIRMPFLDRLEGPQRGTIVRDESSGSSSRFRDGFMVALDVPPSPPVVRRVPSISGPSGYQQTEWRRCIALEAIEWRRFMEHNRRDTSHAQTERTSSVLLSRVLPGRPYVVAAPIRGSDAFDKCRKKCSDIWPADTGLSEDTSWLFEEKYGKPEFTRNCVMKKVLVQAHCVFWAMREKCLLLTYASVVDGRIQLLGGERRELLEQVASGIFGEVSVFVNHIVIELDPMYHIHSRSSGAKRVELWSLLCGHMILDFESGPTNDVNVILGITGGRNDGRSLVDCSSLGHSLSSDELLLWFNARFTDRSFADIERLPRFPEGNCSAVDHCGRKERDDANSFYSTEFYGKCEDSVISMSDNCWHLQNWGIVRAYIKNHGGDLAECAAVSSEVPYIGDLNVVQVCQRMRFDARTMNPHIHTVKISKGVWLQIMMDRENQSLCIDILEGSPFTRLSERRVMLHFHHIVAFVTSYHVSNNAMFAVIDFGFGLTRSAVFERGDQWGLKYISENSGHSRPMSVVSGYYGIIATARHNLLTLWDATNGSVYHEIEMDGSILRLAFDESAGVWVVTPTTLVFVGINGHIIASSPVSCHISAIAAVQISSPIPDRSVIYGTDTGALFLATPRPDNHSIEMKKLPSEHSANINGIFVGGSRCYFVTYDSAGISFVWTGLGLDRPNDVTQCLSDKCQLCGGPRGRSFCRYCHRGMCHKCHIDCGSPGLLCGLCHGVDERSWRFSAKS